MATPTSYEVPSYYQTLPSGPSYPQANVLLPPYAVGYYPPPQHTSMGDTVANAAAVGGRWSAYTGAIFGVIIMIVLLIIGYTSLKDKHTASTPMTITNVTSCNQQSSSNGQGGTTINYTCTISVQFTAGGKQYSSPQPITVTSDGPLASGSSITLRYDPNNPTDIIQESSPSTTGWSLIGVGVAVGVLSVGWAVVVSKSKSAAEFAGAAALVGMVRR